MAFASESNTTLVDSKAQDFGTNPSKTQDLTSSPSPPTTNLTSTAPSDTGLTLKIDFNWGTFRNTITEKSGGGLHPLYKQRFKKSKLSLEFESLESGDVVATSVMHPVAIRAECTIRGEELQLLPFARLLTRYNYLSRALAPLGSADRVAISWVTHTSKKIWDFVCLDHDQNPLARFSVNIWAMTQVGNFHFEKRKEEIPDAVRDEILFVGMTLLYTMALRMNNPLNLLGAALAKTKKVVPEQGLEQEQVEPGIHTEGQTEHS